MRTMYRNDNKSYYHTTQECGTNNLRQDAKKVTNCPPQRRHTISTSRILQNLPSAHFMSDHFKLDQSMKFDAHSVKQKHLLSFLDAQKDDASLTEEGFTLGQATPSRQYAQYLRRSDMTKLNNFSKQNQDSTAPCLTSCEDEDDQVYHVHIQPNDSKKLYFYEQSYDDSIDYYQLDGYDVDPNLLREKKYLNNFEEESMKNPNKLARTCDMRAHYSKLCGNLYYNHHVPQEDQNELRHEKEKSSKPESIEPSMYEDAKLLVEMSAIVHDEVQNSEKEKLCSGRNHPTNEKLHTTCPSMQTSKVKNCGANESPRVVTMPFKHELASNNYAPDLEMNPEPHLYSEKRVRVMREILDQEEQNVWNRDSSFQHEHDIELQQSEYVRTRNIYTNNNSARPLLASSRSFDECRLRDRSKIYHTPLRFTQVYGKFTPKNKLNTRPRLYSLDDYKLSDRHRQFSLNDKKLRGTFAPRFSPRRTLSIDSEDDCYVKSNREVFTTSLSSTPAPPTEIPYHSRINMGEQPREYRFSSKKGTPDTRFQHHSVLGKGEQKFSYDLRCFGTCRENECTTRMQDSDKYRTPPSRLQPRTVKAVLRKKFTWKHYPELEAFLIQNREEYLRHSALNYTVEQKTYNNQLTERTLDLAASLGYVFDEEAFDFVTVRDRIRCYYKSYVQSAKKRGTFVGYSLTKTQKSRAGSVDKHPSS